MLWKAAIGTEEPASRVGVTLPKPVAPLGEALHFLRMSGVFYLVPQTLHRGPRRSGCVGSEELSFGRA